MRIGILGSGLMGAKLGTIFARTGHEVIFSYSRSTNRLEELAEEAGENATAGTPAEAARNADALLLAVNWPQIDDVLTQAGDLRGKVVVTCCLPSNDDSTGLTIGRDSSGAEELAKKLPGSHIVCAFNTVPSEVLFGVHQARDKNPRPGLVYCGDDQKAKDVAFELINDVGFEPVDVGGLSVARYTEPFALLIAQIAYEGPGGPEVAYRFEHFRVH